MTKEENAKIVKEFRDGDEWFGMNCIVNFRMMPWWYFRQQNNHKRK